MRVFRQESARREGNRKRDTGEQKETKKKKKKTRKIAQ